MLVNHDGLAFFDCSNYPQAESGARKALNKTFAGINQSSSRISSDCRHHVHPLTSSQEMEHGRENVAENNDLFGKKLRFEYSELGAEAFFSGCLSFFKAVGYFRVAEGFRKMHCT